jgi:WD40 repeat protein
MANPDQPGPGGTVAASLTLAPSDPSTGDTPSSQHVEPEPHSFRPAIPDYSLLRVIGRGAYGEVWLIRSLTGIYRAGKIVWRNRFIEAEPYEREVNAIRLYAEISLQDPRLLKVLHVGRNDRLGYVYYVMELADDTASHGGDEDFDPVHYEPRTLSAELARQKSLSVAQTIGLGADLCRALDSLHQRGLVHRDIKPANIAYVAGMPKLCDVGLVTPIRHGASNVGTEGYIPPEGSGLPAADVYALGKVLYEAATGNRAKDFPKIDLARIPARDLDLWRELNEILLRSAASRVEDRYRRPNDLLGDLLLVEAGTSVRGWLVIRRRMRWVKWGVALLLALTVLGIGLARVQQRIAEVAKAGRKEAEVLKHQMERSAVDADFDRHRDADGIARLAALVRDNRSDANAVSRLVSALSHGRLPQFVSTPIALDTTPAVVALDATGARLAVGYSNSVFEVWTLSAMPSRLLQHPITGEPRCIALSPDGARVAIGTRLNSGEGLVQCMDVATQQVELSHTNSVWLGSLAFGPLGFRLAGGDAAGKVMLWDSPIAAPMTRQWRARIMTLAWHPRGDRLAVGGWSSDADLLDATTLETVQAFRHNEQLALTLAFDPGGRWFAVAPFAYAVSVFDLTSTNTAAAAKLASHGHPTAVTFSEDGRRIAVGSEHYSTRIWEAGGDGSDFELRGETTAHQAPIRFVRFRPDGHLLAVDQGGTGNLWNTESSLRPALAVTNAIGSFAVSFSRDGQRILFTRMNAAPVCVHLDSQRTAQLNVTNRTQARVSRFLGDGRRAVSVFNNQVFIWDCDTGALTCPPLVHEAGVLCMDVDPAGARAVTASGLGVVQVWDAATGAKIGPEIRQVGQIWTVAFSPNGRTILTGCDNGAANLWNAENGTLVRGPWLHRDWVRGVAFSRDGHLLVTASKDHTVNIWNAATGARHCPQLIHRSAAWEAQFTIDGKRVVTCTADGTAQLWDITTGEPVGQPMEHDEEISGMALSLDGRHLVTCAGRRLRVWDAESGAPVLEPLDHPSQVVGAALSPDGRRIAAAATGSGVWIWELNPPELPAPDWLPNLAERVVGRRMTDRGTLINTRAEPIGQLRYFPTNALVSAYYRRVLDDVLRERHPGSR